MVRDENRKLKIVLLVILTIAVIVLTIIESLRYFKYRDGDGPGYFYPKDNTSVVYRGDIYAETVKSRTETVNSMAKTTMQFYESRYDFGVVHEGDVVKHSFRFKNTGNNPLMIAKADVTCGCTVPEFPVDAITAGSDGEIVVVYNTTGKSGITKKDVTIHANTLPEAITIYIEADVR